MGSRSDTLEWPVTLQPADEGGYIVNFPDMPCGWSEGDDRDEAMAQAEDLLEEMVLGAMAHDEEVPFPSSTNGRPTVRLPALTAAKLEAYRAMRGAGLDKQRLAERLGWQPAQVKRLFDGRHAARLDQLEAVLGVLGRRFVISSEAA